MPKKTASINPIGKDPSSEISIDIPETTEQIQKFSDYSLATLGQKNTTAQNQRARTSASILQEKNTTGKSRRLVLSEAPTEVSTGAPLVASREAKVSEQVPSKLISVDEPLLSSKTPSKTLGKNRSPSKIPTKNPSAIPTAIPTASSTKKTVVSNISTTKSLEQSDINKTLNEIRSHLDNLDMLQNEFGTKNLDDNVLRIGDQLVSLECMLHYLSNNNNFLPESRDQCSAIISKYIDANNNLDLTSLISLSPDKNFLSDSTFYENLYYFIISMAKYISDENILMNLDPITQKTLLFNVRSFIAQSLDYLNKYMNNYEVIDNNLINSSYNLMYLLNSLTIRNASVGQSIEELQKIYGELRSLISDNINIYNKIYKKIDSSKIDDKNIAQSSMLEKEIQELISRLKSRMNILEKQSESLNENSAAIDADTASLENFVDENIKILADNFHKI